jgi:hypothetical protein
MSTAIYILIAVVAVLVIAGVLWYMQQSRRSHALKDQFGPEYDRTVRESDNRREAEAELQRRTDRVSQLEIRPLSSDDRGRFANDWQIVQGRFVDDPEGAVADADALVADVMQMRGYPVGDFEQRAADVSVDHPVVVSNYREAHRLATLSAQGKATTEDLRQSMVHYRALFDDLLGDGQYSSARGTDEQAMRA